MKRTILALSAIVSLLCISAAVASDGIQYNTSVSQAYDSRSILTNPAALGYQTSLNGFGFYYAHTHGFQSGLVDEHSTSLVLGYFGFGYEKLAKGVGDQSRYSLGVGVPLGPYWYLGGRYRFTTSDVASLTDIRSFDLGVQVRPHRKLSLGFMGEGLNRPIINGTEATPNYTLGFTYRVIDSLDLSADVITPGNQFLKSFTAQTTLGWEFVRGARLYGGFHTDRKILAGLQINLGAFSLFSSGYTGGANSAVNAGLQISHVPYRSAWMPPTALEMKIDDSIGEAPLRGGLLGSDKPAFWQLLDTIEKASDRPEVKRLSIRLDEFPLGFAAAEDLYDALWKARASGKQVEIYLSNTSPKEYLIASAANRIVMEPTAEIRFTGLRGQRYFFKGILDKIGVEGEFYAKGEFKSAPEAFTRKESSEISRNETLRELKVAEALIIGLLGKGREFTEREWNNAQKEALISATKAKELGLIDEIAHFQEDIEKRNEGLLTRRELKELSESLALPKRIAIVVARGNIMQDEVKLLTFAGESQITPRRMERQLQHVVNDNRTAGVVLRVSSPGGEVVASDEIAASVRKTNEKKPVVVSMGDVAASGGYFIAAPASKIFAQPLTITGSIGVFLGKFNLKKLFEKVDLNKEILTYSPYPGLLSEDRAWSEPEKKVMLRRLDEYYTGFVDYVATHRKLKKSEAERAAKGRVMLGNEATELKIVDEAKGYSQSVEEAARLAGLSPGEYETYIVREKGGLFDLFGDESPLMEAPQPVGTVLKEMNRYSFLGSGKFLYWFPYSLLD